MQIDRRAMLKGSGAGLIAANVGVAAAAAPDAGQAAVIAVPDDGWRLWIDRAAKYQDDAIFLPSQVDLARLPVNPPSVGWDALAGQSSLTVTLPATVEQFTWGAFGKRPYTTEEYRFADEDAVPQFGAYHGVSWWHRPLDIPAAARGKRVILTLRGARLRAEVYLNRRLVGYSIMAELPFECDLTEAMRPGGANELAIRITNPGGRFDWRDSAPLTWGKVKLFSSHGFGGMDRGLTLSLHPIDARIRDAWVLNTAEPRTVTAHVELDHKGRAGKPVARLLDAAGRAQPATIELTGTTNEGGITRATFRIISADATLWDLDSPTLYRLEVEWAGDRRTVDFGFRWFTAEGIGSNAMLRLNGRRIKLYSSISWGYWAYNGMWPTPELARREVEVAKELGLNCLHFHRKVAVREVMDLQDRLGLLRVAEPGGGLFAIGKPEPGKPLSPADLFLRDYMVEKCVAMVRAFRSHPSLAHYTLQNEINVDLANPDVQSILLAMHKEDPSRAVVLNDGYVIRGDAQAMYLPYDDHYYRSDKQEWGGWWVGHQGAGDQWYDRFYKAKDDYIHRKTGKGFIIAFGEMEGCAVPDHHGRVLKDIARGPAGRAYDREDHEEILRGTDAFLRKWGFDKAFPDSDALFRSLGRKQFDAWANYMENIRIGDDVDVACISGWETTAIDNHAGIVDNFREPKGDAALIRGSLLPVRAIAKQRRLAYALGESAALDVYLFNDSGRPFGGAVTVSVIDPAGAAREVRRFAAPAQSAEQFAYLLGEAVETPPLAAPGLHRIRVDLEGRADARFERDIWVTLEGRADARFERDIWVTAPARPLPRPIRIGAARIALSFQKQLAAIAGVTVEEFAPGRRYDLIVSSGLKADEIARRQVGEQTGLELRPRRGQGTILAVGEIPPSILDAAQAGTPCLLMVPEDGLARGAAQQLAARKLLAFDGEVGTTRAPWMGNWNYLRAHPLFEGIPVDMAAGVLHQIESHPSNGLVIDGDGIEVMAGYSRDHDRRNGASAFTIVKGRARILFHRLPDMAPPLQQRFLLNALHWLTDRR
ncbi:hypothetical protein PQ455_15895 [Sphingomonas naphthae]|uniref:Glycoside hydrolase n=1 Tax=Sphingomonas naphthae TaxID=1813468 RepID=A0ABY7TIP5_9SPHN|nr:sugar-binding domain-containing protein [Sphingomonas naphthae]WCT73096.1 hypothetical protein PQ455_15895 [Sphingomonas naphthae]